MTFVHDRRVPRRGDHRPRRRGKEVPADLHYRRRPRAPLLPRLLHQVTNIHAAVMCRLYAHGRPSHGRLGALIQMYDCVRKGATRRCRSRRRPQLRLGLGHTHIAISCSWAEAQSTIFSCGAERF